ncbi:MAG: hypothetical protein AAB354_06305 [candidate division KSB1 bacterium]
MLFSVAFLRCTENTLGPVSGEEALLHYDKDQDSSPFLAAGRYEAAARFTSTQIGNRTGRDLAEVRYYVANKPESMRVKIYGAQSSAAPGSLLYSADVLAATQPHTWNTHLLAQPVRLTSNDIWISLEFSHSARQATLGCDPGPAVTDGDWLYAADDGQWQTLRQRTTININWNIRGVVK